MGEEVDEHPRPLRRRGRVVMLLLAAGIFTDALAIAADLDSLTVLDQLERGVDVSFERVEQSDNRVANVAIAQLVTYVGSVIAFLAWFFRAYRNLPRLGASSPSHGFGWAIGGWFVPILNLFRPKQIANEVWRGSDPDAPRDQGLLWKDRAVSPLLHWWWAGWLLASTVGNYADRLYLGAETVAEQQKGAIAAIVSASIFIIAAIVALLMVRAVTRRQEARRMKLAGAPDAPAALDAAAAQTA